MTQQEIIAALKEGAKIEDRFSIKKVTAYLIPIGNRVGIKLNRKTFESLKNKGVIKYVGGEFGGFTIHRYEYVKN